MRTTSSKTVTTVEIELDSNETHQIESARSTMREMLKDEELTTTEFKALENAVYLISVVLGRHT